MNAHALRIQLLIAFMCVALVVYFLLLGRIAMAFITSGSAAAIGLGLAVLIMPLIGIWVMVSTLQAGFAHQRLARIIREEGMELDVSGLPRMPSGRIQRDAADALFETVRGELDKDPDNWRRWYRLARAYDYAGDRQPRQGGDEESPGTGTSAAGAGMTKRLLIVHHTPSPHCQEMFEAVVAGATDPEIEGVEVVRRPALTVSAVEMLEADGYLLGTPANLGYLSGAMKHAFDQSYYQLLDSTPGRPFGVYLHGNEGTEGAERAIDGITAGLGWVQRCGDGRGDGQADQGRRRGVLEPRRDGRRPADGLSEATRFRHPARHLNPVGEALIHRTRASPRSGHTAGAVNAVDKLATAPWP